MSNKNIKPPKGGLLRDLFFQIRLVIRLMKDERISPFLKILPFGGLLYFIIPDLVIGPFDDAAILMVGSYLFLELCPQSIVEEHRNALREGRNPNNTRNTDHEVIDGEFRDIE